VLLKGEETIVRSVSFLLIYDRDLLNLTNDPSQNKGILHNVQLHVSNPSGSGSCLTRREASIRRSWQRPCEGRLKINVDASFTPEVGAATVGIVGRDYCGVIAMAASINIAKCRDAKEAEACAIREGIKMGLGLNLLPATIESDCDIAIAAANKLQTKASRCWSVYKDIAHLKDASPGYEIISTSRL
jgi:hypothetical protein